MEDHKDYTAFSRRPIAASFIKPQPSKEGLLDISDFVILFGRIFRT